MDGCIFCKIINKEIPNHTVYEDENFLAFLDINPAGRHMGHTLLITKKHFSNRIEELDDSLVKEYFIVMKKIVPAIRKVAGVEAVNILQNSGKEAGQLLDHFHFHIIPRGEGDGIRLDENRQHNAKGLSEVAEKIKAEIK